MKMFEALCYVYSFHLKAAVKCLNNILMFNLRITSIKSGLYISDLSLENTLDTHVLMFLKNMA